ncbi:MAG TPA: hypothetical protein VIS48_12820 [Candidatus Kryptonia bacterium]
MNIRTSSSYVYVCASNDGLYRQLKSSLTDNWEYVGLRDSSLNTEGVFDVLVHNENEILAAIVNLKTNLPGIVRSTNLGRTWMKSDSGFGFSMPYVIPADSGKYSSCETLFGLSDQPETVFAAGTEDDGIYRSTNFGLVWQVMSLPTLNDYAHMICYAQDPLDLNVIYAGGNSSASGASVIVPAMLLKSTDRGSPLWIPMLDISHVYYDNAVYTIALTAQPERIYLGMRGFVLSSNDAGTTWNKLAYSEDVDNLLTVVADPVHGTHLLYSSVNTFYESLDTGRTWTKLTHPGSGMVEIVTWDKQTDNLYVSVKNKGGVFVLPKASSVPLQKLEKEFQSKRK